MQDTKSKEIKDIIDSYADAALRTICLAYRDLSEGDFGEKYSNPQNDTTCVKEVE